MMSMGCFNSDVDHENSMDQRDYYSLHLKPHGSFLKKKCLFQLKLYFVDQIWLVPNTCTS